MCRVSRVRLRVWLVVDRARLRSDHRRRRRGCGCAIPASSPRRRRSRGASVVVDRVASSATLPCHTSWRPWSCRARDVRAPTGSTATTYHAMEPHTCLFILRYKCYCSHGVVFITTRDPEAVLSRAAVPVHRGRYAVDLAVRAQNRLPSGPRSPRRVDVPPAGARWAEEHRRIGKTLACGTLMD